MNKNLVIGLSGSFGSGCGTTADYLEKKGFKIYSLTDRIKEEVKKRGIVNAQRHNYQDIGDEFRCEEGKDFLAKDVMEKIDWDKDEKIVIKSIRNHYEALFFNSEVPNFYFWNIDSPKELRRKRMFGFYTSDEEFERDDLRDTGEDEYDYGQQVKKCVDMSDIVINNTASIDELHEKIDRYLSLIESPACLPPSDIETNMAQAYFWSLKSQCLKRKVGAVIVKMGHTIASGYNETPRNIRENSDGIKEYISPSCGEMYGVCYRDKFKRCLSNGCHTEVISIQGNCPHCGYSTPNDQRSVLSKHLDLCRALHAEERAILQVAKLGGQSLAGASLYTTTFPCQLCAKKIVEVGIIKVVYVDPYPYKIAVDTLKTADVILEKFEGVKSKKFDNLYVAII